MIRNSLRGVGYPLRAGGLVRPARNAFMQTRDRAAMLMFVSHLLFNPTLFVWQSGILRFETLLNQTGC